MSKYKQFNTEPYTVIIDKTTGYEFAVFEFWVGILEVDKCLGFKKIDNWKGLISTRTFLVDGNSNVIINIRKEEFSNIAREVIEDLMQENYKYKHINN